MKRLWFSFALVWAATMVVFRLLAQPLRRGRAL